MRGITTPYSERVYVSPAFYEWKEWFAWRPVKMVYWNTGDEDGFGKGIRVYKWVWLKKIIRRKVYDRHDGPGREMVIPMGVTHYEYATLMDLLKHGY